MNKKLKKKVDQLLKFGDFCEVTSDYLSNDGLNQGAWVFVAGTQMVPEDDLYTYRVKCIVNLLNEEHIDTTKFFLVDPSSLKRMHKRRSDKLTKIMEEDFSPQETEKAEEVN